MPPTCVDPDAVDYFAIIAINQVHFLFRIEFYQCQYVININSTVTATGLPGCASVVTVLVLVNPDFGVGKQIDAISVVPVQMRNNDVGNLSRQQSKFNQRV